jgi:hypothetical protein
MGKTSKNEELKLAAGYLNALAAGVMITGYVVPGWGLLTGNINSPIGLSAVFILAVVVSIALHLTARSYIRLIED